MQISQAHTNVALEILSLDGYYCNKGNDDVYTQ
jgi:hypothetical protein